MKNVLAVLCAVALVFGMAGMASAGNVLWTILEDTSVTGHGPGADLRIGTGDDTLISDNTETNKCNFTAGANCAASGAPTTGSYSFVKMDLLTQDYSCADGANAGQECTDTGSPVTDCGAGAILGCVSCEDPTFTYLGIGTNLNGNGTMTICNSGSGFSYSVLKIGTTESVPGLSGGCLTLDTPGDDTGTPCGLGAFNSTLDVTIKVAACLVAGGRVPNVAMTGRVYQMGAAVTSGACGYDVPGVQALMAQAPANATYFMVSCANNQTLPLDLTTACISGSRFNSKIIAYSTTSAADFSCSAECGGGGCMMGSADEAE
ncbi:MAG: hypothetical protein AB1640_05290 [bacterium]